VGEKEHRRPGRWDLQRAPHHALAGEFAVVHTGQRLTLEPDPDAVAVAADREPLADQPVPGVLVEPILTGSWPDVHPDVVGLGITYRRQSHTGHRVTWHPDRQPVPGAHGIRAQPGQDIGGP